MRRAAVGAAAAFALITLSGCTLPFYHSDRSLYICANAYGGWSSKACGDALCVDYIAAYPGSLCPIEVEYATGPR